MTNTNNKYIYTALVIATLLLCAMLFVGLFFNNNKVYADYEEDIQNNPNAIINFNQYINITNSNSANISVVNGQTISINTTLTGASNVDITPFNYISGHKYYFYTNVPFDNRITFAVDYSGYLTSYEQYIIFDATSNFTFNRLFLYANETTKQLSINLIDLTQLFGADNDNLTLQQCKDLFVADFYP